MPSTDGPKTTVQPRMRDVADAAGVSVSTVSRALQNAESISPAVRARVAEAADRLGYDRPVREAQPSAGGSVVMMVGIEIFSGDAGGFYASIFDSIEDEADRLGLPLETILIGADGTVAAPQERTGPRGLLMVGIDAPDLIASAAAEYDATILVNGQDPAMHVDGIAPANRRGAKLATEYLISLGHTRIAHVTARRRQTIRDRIEGYQAALMAAGLPVDHDLLIDLPQLHPEAAVQAIRARLAKGPLGATALFCGCDIVAAGCIAALTEAGLKVPEDVSVIGFDNTRGTLRIRPALTTIAIDTTEMVRRAFARLVERMANPDLTQSDVTVGCTLIQRASTAPPKDAL